MKAAIPRQSASPTKRWRPSTSPPIRGILSGTTSSAQGHQDDAVIVERCLSCLAEAAQIIETTEERLTEADLHRVRGDLLNASGDPSAAELSYRQALSVAERQSAK